ncbi:MAG: family 43 glycosylhydrolase [Opitutaceae bacterium]
MPSPLSRSFRSTPLLAGAALLSSLFMLPSVSHAAPPAAAPSQRHADLGNGTFLNPILAGDHPDPSVLKEGDEYYLVCSSFESTPGLLVWHSRDLVNWEPLGPALNKPVGSVWAPDLCKHDGRYYIYFPALSTSGLTNMVVHADSPRGPWSDPVDLQTGNIDPGHITDENGKRYLFFSAGFMAPLSDDGLSLTGPQKKVYDGWKYPEAWDVEVFAQEGPKMLRHGDYYYMVLAEGGTAGPATSHMVIMARSKSLEGPWENSPYNPIVHTASATEKWWSRGHATLVEGPDRQQWYLVYHAYENGHYNLGRQTLLEPVEWTADGWVKAVGADVAAPLPQPAGGTAVPHGFAYSDDFSTDKIGVQWALHRAATADVRDTARVENGTLVLQARGTSPKDGTLLNFVTGDHDYEVQVEVECDAGATAGLLAFYSDRLFAGLGISDTALLEYRKGDVSSFTRPAPLGRRFFLRLRNARNVVTTWYSADGTSWARHWMQVEVSAYHHNVADGFLSLRPTLHAAGTGAVRFRNFQYRVLAP